ncbi:hypothetical protein BC940DRAFT_323386 [Gongronella butleri]|nr:hypothetical protein BC940DRAFT_323386 [Gongronella butleri]
MTIVPAQKHVLVLAIVATLLIAIDDASFRRHCEILSRHGQQAQKFWGQLSHKIHPDIVHSNLTNVAAKSYNLARLLMETYSIEDYVIVKMDAEGAEHDLIPHLI